MTEPSLPQLPSASLHLLPFGPSELVASWFGPVQSVGWVRAGERLLLATGGQGIGDLNRGLGVFELVGDRLVALGEPVRSWFGPVGSVGWVRAGERLLLAAGGGLGELGGLSVFELVGDRLVALGEPVPSRIGPVGSVGWVRAGERLLLAAGGGLGELGGLSVFELVGDRLVALGEPVRSSVSTVESVGWVRAGERLLLATDGNLGLEVFELAGEQLVPLGGPVPSRVGSVMSVGWVRAGDRLLLAAGGHGDGVGRAEVFELVDDRPVPLGEPVASRVSAVQSVAWVQAGERLVLAAGGNLGVEVFELAGDRLIPLGEPAPSSVSAVHSVGWVWAGDRLLLAAGGYVSSGRGRVWVFELAEVHVVPRLPAYRSDTAGGADKLERTGEARALAELLTAVSARPPLAVGLFGDWGQGKSHFLDLLRAQVDATARPDNPLAHQAVRQVRFNAWHYAETGLWPSLVSELFTQLAIPADGADPAQVQRSLSALSARLLAERQLPHRLRAAEQRLEQLNQAVRRGTPWELLPPAERADLVRQAGGEESAARLYAEVASGAAVLRETLFTWRQTTLGLLRSRAGWYLAVWILLAGAAVAVVAAWPWLPRWLVGLPALAPLLALGRLTAGARARVRTLRAALQDLAERQRSRSRGAALLAAGEVDALKRQMRDLTAAGQLAGLVEERAADSDYRARLGVMTRIREDFERMAALLAQASADRHTDQTDRPGAHDTAPGAAADAAGDTLPSIDRIVLYIDDLDRCPPARVVDMLEAIHLLLAVDLFVVVVALDPRWLLAAITAHYREILQATDGPDDGPGPFTPAQYLEKIFQVVFTLPPLQEDGYRRLLRSLVTVRTDTTPADTTTAAPERTRAAPDLTPHPGNRTEGESGDGDGPPDPVPQARQVRIVERTDPLTLEAEELQLLDLLGPPLMVADPRAVKRLANSYGLLTALRRDQRERDLAEHPQPTAPDTDPAATYRPYRAGMVLLAALVAHPAQGPALCLHLHQRALDTPEAGWRQFCAHLAHPDGNPGAPGRSGPGPQDRALGRALLHVTDQARNRGLALPHALGPWREWVIPAARLSFPAGQAVGALHRQQPLPSPIQDDELRPRP